MEDADKCTVPFFENFRVSLRQFLMGKNIPEMLESVFFCSKKGCLLCATVLVLYLYIYMTDVPGWHLFLFLFLLLLLLLLLLLAVCYIEWILLMGQLAKDLSETWKKLLSSHKFWEKCSDLGWGCPKMWFSKGIPPKFLLDSGLVTDCKLPACMRWGADVQFCS